MLLTHGKESVGKVEHTIVVRSESDFLHLVIVDRSHT